jgi:uncharacterized protein YyaL (SSP411 family)
MAMSTMKTGGRLAGLVVTCLGLSGAPAKAADGIAWQDWSDGVFARARLEKRLVLLDLGAVWCHWCHVMEETTYKDPKVIALVREHYLPVRVDQDSRPDLSNRYEDYGWPATVVFDGQGQELVTFAGYIPPQRMISLLEAIVADPTPGPSVRPAAAPAPANGPVALSGELREELQQLLASRYDTEHGGWGFTHKFLDWDAVEYSMLRARDGDHGAETRARETLARELQLIDPVWGGVYQYSDSGTWDHPHFEKIMAFQAENLRTYAQAYAQWHNPEYLLAARNIHRYLRAFLASPEGAFYVSQDADLVEGEHAGEYYALGDAERRKRGVPRVDTHLYARETAWASNALTALYQATGEQEVLGEALRAARWIVDQRGLPGGGFRHDASDAAGPYLGDSLAAGRAFLALHRATGDPLWLTRAEQAAEFIAKHFRTEGAAGFATSAGSGLLPSAPQTDENVSLARFATVLYQQTHLPAHRELALHALAYLATPEVARRSPAGVLLAWLTY